MGIRNALNICDEPSNVWSTSSSHTIRISIRLYLLCLMSDFWTILGIQFQVASPRIFDQVHICSRNTGKLSADTFQHLYDRSFDAPTLMIRMGKLLHKLDKQNV